MRLLSKLMAAAFLATALLAQGPPFRIRSDFGDEGAWVEAWLERAHAELVKLMEAPRVAPPAEIEVTWRRDPSLPGVGGGATARSLMFTSDHWPKDRFRIWILTHELVNLFAHHYAGAGGYPSDWWADGRSPFPVYVAALVTRHLGETETAEWLRGVDKDRPDQRFIWALHERFGFKLFARFLGLLRADGVDLGKIGAPWPAADERRSAWTLAYLSLAAGTNLAPLAREHGIGREPSDWRTRHPELPFTAYVVSDQEVADLLELRAHLFGPKAKGRAIELLRAHFRQGTLWNPEPEAEPPAVGPIAFDVVSDFGAASDWTGPFLTRAAAKLARLLEDPALPLPERVTVRLIRNPEIGGIGGGVRDGSLEFLSDKWPKERFRLWILASHLVSLLGPHLGGQIPDDWFGHGTKPFANHVASVVLQELGHEEEARWLREMCSTPEDELFRRLHEDHGFGLFARTFASLRRERVSLAGGAGGAGMPARERTHKILAYLSRAAGKNLAPLFREHGIGRPKEAPAGFLPYEIEDARVERLMTPGGM